jgi:hypothetical protein
MPLHIFSVLLVLLAIGLIVGVPLAAILSDKDNDKKEEEDATD